MARTNNNSNRSWETREHVPAVVGSNRCNVCIGYPLSSRYVHVPSFLFPPAHCPRNINFHFLSTFHNNNKFISYCSHRYQILHTVGTKRYFLQLFFCYILTASNIIRWRNKRNENKVCRNLPPTRTYLLLHAVTVIVNKRCIPTRTTYVPPVFIRNEER